MPELAEIMIMSDFINDKSENKTYNNLFFIEKGNTVINSNLTNKHFKVKSNSAGKELSISIYHDVAYFDISVFMGMSGNWSFIPTKNWNDIKHVRLRLDTIDGFSLLLHGGYLGPKYKIGRFNGVKRGPDPIKEFNLFKNNILTNLDNKVFDKPICDVLLNQTYFSGIGNYLRSTILYYLDINPFLSARVVIEKHNEILELCRDIPIKAYELNGGQLKDWKNPFNSDSNEFNKWVFYQKGLSCKDSTGRTFWYSEKWKDYCPY
jgi:endonuclease VIII-like 1